MGPHYDNEKQIYLLDDEVMNSHWLLHQDTEQLYLVPKSDHGFDTYGPDEDIEMQLNALDDDALSNDIVMSSKGFDVIPQWQRRFCPQAGYYVA